MITAWPKFSKDWDFAADENAVETIKAAVKGIRNVRAEMNVPPSKKALVYVVSEDERSVKSSRPARCSLLPLAMPAK